MGRDLALLRAIDGAVRRRWLTLEAIVAPLLARPGAPPPPLRAALLAGAAQLLLLDRLPDHAVLDETVEWTKRRVGRSGAGLVNAVLRRVVERRDGTTIGPAPRPPRIPQRGDLLLADGRVRRFEEPFLPEDPARRIALATSHAPLLVRRWIDRLGVDAALRVALKGVTTPPTVLFGTPEAGGSDLLPHEAPGAFVFVGDDLPAMLRREPTLRVQDPASAAAVAALDEAPAPRIVVDLCAGRGTKTRQLGARWPEATILASDVDPQRMQVLRDWTRGTASIRAIEAPRLEEAVAALGGADLVLLDVPCSNTGVLARRLEARYRFTESRLASLVRTQQAIVRRGAGLLRRGGALLHATCSVEAEENETQWAWIAAETGLARRRAESLLPVGLPGDLPSVHRDGGSWAIFGGS